MFDPSADPIRQQHASFEDAIGHAVRRAGLGPDTVFERRLMGEARALQDLLDDRTAAQAVADTAEAARRVMDAAEPAAPLQMLEIARMQLSRLIRRHAAGLGATRRAA